MEILQDQFSGQRKIQLLIKVQSQVRGFLTRRRMKKLMGDNGIFLRNFLRFF